MALISATAKHIPPVYRLQWRATGADFHAMLESVKAIAGRRFDITTKTWSVPDLPQTAYRLRELGFVVESNTKSTTELAPIVAPAVHAYAHEWENIPIDRSLFPDLFPKQIGDLQFFTWAGGKALLVGEVGYGKRLAFGTPVLTLEGYKAIETLEPGVDKVLGIDGKPYNVLEKWINFDRPLFRVKFSDGTEIDADDEHLWTVADSVNYWKGPKWQTLTTAEIIAQGIRTASKGQLKWRLPITEAVDFPATHSADMSYACGVAMGDGSRREGQTSWTICTDKAILEKIGANILRPHETCDYVAYGTLSIDDLPSAQAWDKKIPASYKLNDSNGRLAVLRGLMDTDGWNNVKGSAMFSSCSKQLVDDVEWLVRSLGGVTNAHAPKRAFYTYKGEKLEGRTAYIVNVQLPKGVNPFKLQRKAEAYKHYTKYGPAIRIESITRIPNGPGCCISVDSPDHLYLTKNCIPTHNTISGLSWLKLRPDLRPALIVTRANIKTQWQRQWRKWVGDGSIPEILSGETPYSLRPDRSYIINREILHRWEDELARIAPKCIEVDECQDFGNDTAKKTVEGIDEKGEAIKKSVSVPVLRTTALQRLCKNAQSIIELSATPFASRVQQFFTPLNIIAPNLFPNKWAYQMRYCDAKPGNFGGWDFTGASNLEELHAKTARLMLFRDRDRTNVTRHQTLILDTEMNDKERAKELATLSAWDVGGNLEGALLALEELSSAHFKYKRKAVFQWIKGQVDNGEKLVVFARHRAVVEAIAGSLGKKGALYYGGMTDRTRTQSLTSFIKGPAQVLVANIQAAGVGLDGLQHASHRVAFAEIPVSASDAKQCIGRVDRTGQNKDVDAIFLCGEGTADELALQVLKERWSVLDCIRHGTAISDTDAVMDAVNKWKAKR